MAINDHNIAIKNNYIFTIEKLPGLELSLTSAMLPGITLNETRVPTKWHDLPVPSEKLEFDPLVLEFIVDESFANYLEIVKWMRRFQVPRDLKPNSKVPYGWKDLMSDGALTVYSNNQVPIQSFKFISIWPTFISEVSFLSSSGDEHQQCSLNLKYQEFEVV